MSDFPSHSLSVLGQHRQSHSASALVVAGTFQSNGCHECLPCRCCSCGAQLWRCAPRFAVSPSLWLQFVDGPGSFRVAFRWRLDFKENGLGSVAVVHDKHARFKASPLISLVLVSRPSDAGDRHAWKACALSSGKCTISVAIRTNCSKGTSVRGSSTPPELCVFLIIRAALQSVL